MTEPEVGVALLIHIRLLTPEEGGLAQPVQNGYRPLCIVPVRGDDVVVIGLCELELTDELSPGGSGEGRLLFSTAVSEQVRLLVSAGSQFMLAEGTRPIGTAEVRSVE
jgi:translation elongation factor EF-Tu-like GTPase